MNDSGYSEPRALDLLAQALDALDSGYTMLPEAPATHEIIDDAFRDTLLAAATRMHDNYPYAHPLYAGQMLKPPHPIARAAYQMAMWVNPNNHALDGGRASSAMEKESVSALATMFGMQQHLGHLTSSGTIANLEALWISREEHPGKHVAASREAHYTHERISKVLQLPFVALDVEPDGRLSLQAIEAEARRGTLGTVVATTGTTSFGAVDPVADIIALARQYDFRVHIDAAYGGYFSIADALSATTREHYHAIAGADSIAIDPHKHGLQPYGCGCILFSDPRVGRHYQHDSPYTYFSSDELHLGEISLECSRAGAAAVALWATQRLLPMQRGAQFAGMLDDCLHAARELAGRIQASPLFELVQQPELDIVVWAVTDKTLSGASARQGDLRACG